MIYVTMDEPYENQLQEDLFIRAAQAALSLARLSETGNDLSIAIEGDDALQALNRQYRQIDAPTDVLSFESDETDPDTGNRYLGDIIISLPRAEAQAAAAGHTVEVELQLLVVHGVLHLLGHDHGEEEEKARMWAAQRAALDQLGCVLARYPD